MNHIEKEYSDLIDHVYNIGFIAGALSMIIFCLGFCLTILFGGNI